MNDVSGINDQWITSLRGKKNSVNSREAYGWLIEKELTGEGNVEEVLTIFLTNMECPFHCLMCDLWKNTTDKPVSVGLIPLQISQVFKQISPGIKHVKLYNSGSFFDVRAVPESDYKAIAELLKDFTTVIVESHPALINDRCLAFARMLKPRLQVAMGLETVHAEVLEKLNKKMTSAMFGEAVKKLLHCGISSRAFILLKPPFMSEEEGVFWAKRSLDYAFEVGVECCTVIPVRAGNGAMEVLQKNGFFVPPELDSIEEVQEYGLSLSTGRVFVDTWDLALFSRCEHCLNARIQRINAMNLSQKITERILCQCK